MTLIAAFVAAAAVYALGTYLLSVVEDYCDTITHDWIPGVGGGLVLLASLLTLIFTALNS